VQDILAARIDRLAPEGKELLQTLAVIGMEFPLTLAREVARQPPDQFDRLLGDLQTAEFIYEHPATGDIEYRFKHALTHDAAYKSLLSERRKLLHERIGQAIEKLFAQSIEDHVSELAHHYSRSANKRKAVEFLGHAGKWAAERSSYAEARGNIATALQLVKDQPDDLERARIELDLEAALNELVMVMTGSTASTEVEQSCMRVRRLSERVGERSWLLQAMFGLSLCYMVRGELAKAKAFAHELLALATQDGAQDLLVGAHFQMAQTLLHMGEFADAVKHCRDALAVPPVPPELHGRRLADAAIVANFVLAKSLCCLGFPDQARQIERNALTEARNVRWYIRVAAMASAAELQQVLGDGRRTLEQTDAGMSYAAEVGVMSQLNRMAPVRAWALVKTGNIEEGITMLREAIALSEASGVGILVRPYCALAEAYQASGNRHEGLEMLRRAEELMDRTSERHWAADLFRLKGELVLLGTPAPTVEAEATFHQAIEVARHQRAKWYELRAITSLARLLRDTDRRDEARGMLAEIYNWFTEGFDTADLKDAKALLDELGA
jgi:predicted ATPase